MSNSKIGVRQGLMLFFSIFMVLFYLGVAVLMYINFFGIPKYLSWFFAVVLTLYGIYRGYREYKGEHTYGMRTQDDEEQYKTYAERLKELENSNDDEKK